MKLPISRVLINITLLQIITLLLSFKVTAQQIGDPGITFDESKFDDRQYPQMREWAKAGVRGGIPLLKDQDIKERIGPDLNSSQINSAIQRVRSNGGGAVFLRDGNYTINSRINMVSGVSLIGESRDKTICSITMTRSSGFYFNRGVRKSGVYRMTIQGSWGTPRYSWNYGIKANNELKGNENVSVKFKGSVDCWLDNVALLNCARDPVRCNAKHTTFRNLHVDGAHKKAGGAQGYFFIQNGYNLITGCYITRLRHISLQGDNVEYNVVYDNDFDQEVSFHSGDDGNNLIENNRITLPADMPPISRAELKPGDRPEIASNKPIYFAIMGPWSDKHDNSRRPNFIINNTCLQLNHNHGSSTPWSESGIVYKGPVKIAEAIRDRITNFPAEPASKSPIGGTLYPVNVGSSTPDPDPDPDPNPGPGPNPPAAGGSQFNPTDDAYLQNGVLGASVGELRLENTPTRKRVSYLRFNLSSLSEEPTSAILTLTGGADPSGGPVTIRVYRGRKTGWNEDALTGDTAPKAGVEIASYTGAVNTGEAINLDLSTYITESKNYSIILELIPTVRDLSFSSKEGSAPPVLTVSTEPGASESLTLDVNSSVREQRVSDSGPHSVTATGVGSFTEAELFLNDQSVGIQSGKSYSWILQNLSIGLQRVVVSARSSDGRTLSKALTFTTIPSGYADWLQEHFSSSDINNQGAGIDVGGTAGNNFPNIADYALGIEPNSSLGPLLKLRKTTSGVEVSHMQRRGDRAGVDIILETSEGLDGDWTETENPSSTTPMSGGMEEATYQIPSPTTETKKFFRLKTQLPQWTQE